MVEVNQHNAAELAAKVKSGEIPGPAKSLAEALARIYAGGGGYVQKTGKMDNFGGRYTYAKETDFIAAIRPLMELHGVTIRPIRMDVVTNETFTRAKGGTAYRVVIQATYELMHTSGDRAEVQAFGEGQDGGDKAFNKAMTAAMKYALRQAFCVETGDDPDDTPSEVYERAASQQTPQNRAPDPRQVMATLTAKYASVSRQESLAALGAEVKRASDAGVLSPDQVKMLRGLHSQASARISQGQP